MRVGWPHRTRLAGAGLGIPSVTGGTSTVCIVRLRERQGILAPSEKEQ